MQYKVPECIELSSSSAHEESQDETDMESELMQKALGAGVGLPDPANVPDFANSRLREQAAAPITLAQAGPSFLEEVSAAGPGPLPGPSFLTRPQKRRSGDLERDAPKRPRPLPRPKRKVEDPLKMAQDEVEKLSNQIEFISKGAARLKGELAEHEAESNRLQALAAEARAAFKAARDAENVARRKLEAAEALMQSGKYANVLAVELAELEAEVRAAQSKTAVAAQAKEQADADADVATGRTDKKAEELESCEEEAAALGRQRAVQEAIVRKLLDERKPRGLFGGIAKVLGL